MITLLERISIDPNICFGKPLQEYPHLAKEDILAAIAYGAEMSRERYVEVPMKAT